MTSENVNNNFLYPEKCILYPNKRLLYPKNHFGLLYPKKDFCTAKEAHPKRSTRMAIVALGLGLVLAQQVIEHIVKLQVPSWQETHSVTPKQSARFPRGQLILERLLLQLIVARVASNQVHRCGVKHAPVRAPPVRAPVVANLFAFRNKTEHMRCLSKWHMFQSIMRA